MDHFSYQNGVYHAEAVSLARIAQDVGTPFYCYSSATLKRHFTVVASQFPADTLICYAVKANGNPAVIRTLSNLGAGADVVSEGEIRLALAGGVPPDRIVFSGVGKMREEMDFALHHGIFQFNVESAPELELLNDAAEAKGMRAAIAVRVNPDVDAGTHAKISTGRKENKFGIAMRDSLPLYQRAAGLPGIRIQGISMHIGSQLTSLAPFSEAFRRIRAFAEELRRSGISVKTVDLGGGLGIPYRTDQKIPSPEAYSRVVREIFDNFDCTLILEPGRLLVGNAGILVARVIYVKTEQERRFVILDAGMNDLIRPALYDAYHEIIPVCESKGINILADIVGPVCETSDIFAEQRAISLPQPGDLMVFRSAGAYGASMANSYNARRAIPEILVEDDRYAVIRPRQSFQEMLGATSMPDWFSGSR